MSLELALQENTRAMIALTEILKNGLGATVVSPDALEEQVLEEKPAPVEKPKRAKKEAKAEAPAPAEEPAEETAPPTYTETAAKVIEVANKKGRDAAAGILGQFGAKKLGEVNASDYAAVICACELALS